MSDIKIVIPQNDIIATVGPKPVSHNGQISVGAQHRGKNVIAYVVEVDEVVK